MHPRAAFELLVIAQAFAERGDGMPAPIPEAARNSATAARDALAMHIGAQVEVTAEALALTVQRVNRSIADGTLSGVLAEVLAAWGTASANRLAEAHPNGRLIASLLGPPPQAKPAATAAAPAMSAAARSIAPGGDTSFRFNPPGAAEDEALDTAAFAVAEAAGAKG